ncbi:MAG: beta-ketoacyl-ACP synthase II [Omnitrophica WOR_2 bacterium]
MRTRVVITGLGVISSLGSDVTSLWKNLLAGKSGVGKITHYDPSRYACHIAAEVKDFDPGAYFGVKEARRMDRFCQFAVVAAEQAFRHAGLDGAQADRDAIGAVIGSGIGGIGTLLDQVKVFQERGPQRVSPFLVPMMISDSAPGMIAIRLRLRGPNMAIATACASGTNAVGEAAEMIRRGHANAILAGGAEAAIIPLAMAGLDVMGALSTRNDQPQCASRPFDLNRDGIVMGEGAAVVVLESLEHAQQRGAEILAEVSGYAANNDAFHISAPSENGVGAALCMQKALDDAGLSGSDISYINAHGTSTQLNDKSETAAIKSVFKERAYQIPVSSTKSMTGHLLGATGALEVLICVQALKDNMIPPTINYETPDPLCDLDYVPNVARPESLRYVMSNSFGFGGHNATIILSQPGLPPTR